MSKLTPREKITAGYELVATEKEDLQHIQEKLQEFREELWDEQEVD